MYGKKTACKSNWRFSSYTLSFGIPESSTVYLKRSVRFLGAMNIYQPVLRHNNFAKAPDTHFARDTHMRIILGNSGNVGVNKSDKKGDSVNSR